MDRYAPRIIETAPGVYVEEWGPAFVLRQQDAEEALAAIGRAASRVVLKVECRDRIVARVYRTMDDGDLDLIVSVEPPERIDGELARINRDMDRTGPARLTYAQTTVDDPLRADDERVLDYPCRCGRVHVLDRRFLLERVAMGESVVDARRAEGFAPPR